MQSFFRLALVISGTFALCSEGVVNERRLTHWAWQPLQESERSGELSRHPRI